MSSLKFNSDLFLGSHELRKWQDMLQKNGYLKLLLENSLSFGLINKDIQDGNWTNFKTELGTNTATIKINDGIAIDSDGNLITYPLTDNIAIANDSLWKYLKISYTISNKEQGTISISASGTLSGVGTEFTKVLRGQPNNASKISFTTSSLNTREYFVVEVISDTEAVLAGDFVSESNISYSVVGSFTPDTITPTDSKYPLQYDSCNIQLITEITPNTPPTLIEGKEFLIARLRCVGTAVTIQDKRSLFVYRDKADWQLQNVPTSSNPLIGVEQITYNGARTPKSDNILQIGFGFRSNNWTTNSGIVTILGGNGGIDITTSDFTDGDFNGWKLYTEDGKYSIISNSYKVATQINCVLDSLEVDSFSANLTQELHIVPNVEEIEIIAKPIAGQSQITEKRFSFLINEGYVKIPLEVYNATSAQYTLSYRYKNFGTYYKETLFPTSNVHGYLGESNFNASGTQTGSVRTTYTSGIVTLIEASNSYSNRIGSVETGDLFGVEYIPLDNGAPVIDFVVGSRKNYVVITNDDNLDQSDPDYGTSYQLTNDIYLNLKTNLPTSIKAGNSFFIRFRGIYDLNGFKIIITQDYVNPVSTGFHLYEISDVDQVNYISDDNLSFDVKFDGIDWISPTPLIHLRGDSVVNSSIKNGVITSAKIASGNVVKCGDGVQLFTRVFEIGDWDMDTIDVASVFIGGATTRDKVRMLSIIIRDDNGNSYTTLLCSNPGLPSFDTFAGTASINASDFVSMRRNTGDFYDSTAFNSTGYNRGWVTIMHEA